MNLIVESHRIYAADPAGKIIAEVTFPAVSADAVDIDHTYDRRPPFFHSFRPPFPFLPVFVSPGSRAISIE